MSAAQTIAICIGLVSPAALILVILLLTKWIKDDDDAPRAGCTCRWSGPTSIVTRPASIVTFNPSCPINRWPK